MYTAPTSKAERSSEMGRSQRKEIKDALEQATFYELLKELFRRGEIELPASQVLDVSDRAVANRVISFGEHLRRRKRQETVPRVKETGQEPGDIDEAVKSVRANTVKHFEYVGQLFGILHRERLEKLREQGILRTNTIPEDAKLGISMTKRIFDHLVIAKREALDAGACDIESLWEYFVRDRGSRFAEGLVKGDIGIPPDLWVSLIYLTVRDAAESFLYIAEENVEEPGKL
jgi:hypothetical protein